MNSSVMYVSLGFVLYLLILSEINVGENQILPSLKAQNTPQPRSSHPFFQVYVALQG